MGLLNIDVRFIVNYYNRLQKEIPSSWYILSGIRGWGAEAIGNHYRFNKHLSKLKR